MTVKKVFFALLLAVLPFSAKGQDVDISVALSDDGSALIREVWDLDISTGTEWYLVRSNLGDIRIKDLTVTDETGLAYINEGEWDVNRSMAQKAGRCGIVHKNDGCEICWGLGSYGHHVYTVNYTMTNAVKSMNDYDALHIQLVSPGIRPRIYHARVTVSADGKELNDDNTGIWAFGYEGTVDFKEGSIVAETDGPFITDEYSMIVLARFNKGLFHSASRIDADFQDKLDTAFNGSSYEEYLKEQKAAKVGEIILAVIAFLTIGLSVLAAKLAVRSRNKRMFGVASLKDIGYERDLPFDGNLLETRYVLGKCNKITSESAIASAMILRMIKNGQLDLTYDEKGKTLISFATNANLDSLSGPEKELYAMMQEASGSDLILQNREFSRWSARHTSKVSAWVDSLPVAGQSKMIEDNYLEGRTYTAEGQKHARRTIGFKNFLKDFTILEERKSTEVALWHDYIVMAALFGIADKVAKELKDIDPKAFEEYVGLPYPVMRNVIYSTDNMGSAITAAKVRQQQQTASSVGGHGGFSSFGGGGGFSGGGFGGGAR